MKHLGTGWIKFGGRKEELDRMQGRLFDEDLPEETKDVNKSR